jgi:hypothetical protein
MIASVSYTHSAWHACCLRKLTERSDDPTTEVRAVQKLRTTRLVHVGEEALLEGEGPRCTTLI